MANWITHSRIADALLALGLPLDPRGFHVGSVAPDCNIPNEDWTAFIPSREATHWMTGKSKCSADFEGFYGQNIAGKFFSSGEEYAFLLGYYAHLITDAAYQAFVRDEARIARMFRRLKENGELFPQITGMPETFDTVKSVFGKRRVFGDIAAMEAEYLRRNPDSGYLKWLCGLSGFPDYLPEFPEGAIVQKAAVMAVLPKEAPFSEPVFFSREEYEDFVERTRRLILEKLREKL